MEAAGLLGDPTSDRKMQDKVALASELGIPLIVITPADLDRLPEIFANATSP